MSQQAWSIDEVQKAWQVASELHAGQTYGGPGQGEQIEYITHIGSVAFEILSAMQHTPGMNAGLALTCAMLHDVVEDTPFTYEQVREVFGAEVAAGVLALTKFGHIEGKRAQLLDSLRRIQQQPAEIWAVKLADRITNLYHPPYYWDHARKVDYLQESEMLFKALSPANKYLADRLQVKIQEYHSFLNE